MFQLFNTWWLFLGSTWSLSSLCRSWGYFEKACWFWGHLILLRLIFWPFYFVNDLVFSMGSWYFFSSWSILSFFAMLHVPRSLRTTYMGHMASVAHGLYAKASVASKKDMVVCCFCHIHVWVLIHRGCPLGSVDCSLTHRWCFALYVVAVQAPRFQAASGGRPQAASGGFLCGRYDLRNGFLTTGMLIRFSCVDVSWFGV